MRTPGSRLARFLIVLLVLLIAIPSAPQLAAAGAQPVSPIATNSDWKAVDEGWTFQHASLPDTMFVYIEHALADLAVPDNLYLMEVATLVPFREAMGVEVIPQLGASDPAADPLWYLHSMEYQGSSYVVLFAVSVTAVSGKGAVEILITPPGSLQPALASAQQGITAYGQPSLMSRVDATAVLAAAGSQGQVPPTQAAVVTSPTATTGPGAGTLVDPTCDPVVLPNVVCNTYDFGGNWAVDPSASMQGQGGGMIAVTNTALSNTSFVYMETPWVANHIADNNALIQQWVAQMFLAAGQAPSTPLVEGTLADGTLWQLYSMTKDGVPYGLLITADTADPSQHDVLTMLTSPVDTFGAALADVQSDFHVNGVSPLEGVDTANVTSALGGGQQPPATQPVSQTPTPAVSTTPGVVGGLTQTVTVGSDTVSYGAEWTYESATSSPELGIFSLAGDSRVTYGYLTGADRVSGGDPQVALQVMDLPASFGAQNVQEVASQVLPSGHAYQLYTWERDGVPEVALTLLDVTTTPGTIRAQVLIAPPDVFLSSFTSAQRSFQINGTAALADLDADTVASLLQGAATTPTATATSVVGTTPTSGGLTLPPLGGETPTPPGTTGQTVTVSGVTITYSDQWVYDTENSIPDELAYFDSATEPASFYGYLSQPAGTGDAAAQLTSYNEGYYQRIGATDVQQLGFEPLSPTSAWSLTSASLVGMPVVVLTYADTSATGELRVQLLFGQADTLPSVLGDAQSSIQLDGASALAGVDPAAVTTMLGGGPAPTPVAGGTTGTVGKTVADYRAADSPTGCDGIGWVATGDAPAPTSQADRDAQGACVGGASYIASCGLADMAGIPYLSCTVEVTVTGAPMVVSQQQFSVVDGAGQVYPVDTEITTLMNGVFGAPSLPESTVNPGAPVTGTLYFAVPVDAPQPWVIQVAPDTITNTGEAPGTLVIESALQPAG